MTIPNLMKSHKNVDEGELSLTPERMKNCVDTLESSLTVSFCVKHNRAT
jgi:hypothetical protein